MKKNELIRYSCISLTILFVFTFGLLVGTSQEASAFPELSTDGTCLECHPDGIHEDGEPTESEDPSEQPAEPTEPTEAEEPEEEKSTNPLLIMGLVLAVPIIGGAIWLDKRK